MRLLPAVVLSTFAILAISTICAAADDDTIIVKKGAPADTVQDTSGTYGTDGDANPLPRNQARRYGMAGFGPAGFGVIGSGKVAYNLYGGYAWDVSQYAMIKAYADATADFINSALGSISLGLNISPIAAEISPFFGASLGLGWAHKDSDNAVGFDVGANAGLMLFRTSTAQMIIDGQAHVILNEIRSRFPYIYAVRVGILF